MAQVRLYLLFIILNFSFQAFSYEDIGGFYRDEFSPIVESATCGSLCISNPNYYEGYLYQRERNNRLFAPELIKTQHSRKTMDATNYKKFSGRTYIQGLGWGPDSKVSRFVMKKRIRLARLFRNVGYQVAEREKSLSSAFFRELRKPMLYSLRDWVTAPYKRKKLSIGEKARVWFLEQTVDAGASSLDLDSFGGSGGRSFDTNFDIKDFILKFYPRVDPIKGRYGVRFKARKYIAQSRPLHLALSLNYCNSSTGFGDKTCGYHHEVSTSFSFVSAAKRWAYSLYVSYQTKSLDEDAYVVDGESYDHKPWVSGVRITYAFY